MILMRLVFKSNITVSLLISLIKFSVSRPFLYLLELSSRFYIFNCADRLANALLLNSVQVRNYPYGSSFGSYSLLRCPFLCVNRA